MLIRYGYHGLYGLACLIKEEFEREYKEEVFRDYVGQALWHITTIQHFKATEKNTMPQYIELSHPETKNEDTRSSEEIIQYVLDGLG